MPPLICVSLLMALPAEGAEAAGNPILINLRPIDGSEVEGVLQNLADGNRASIDDVLLDALFPCIRLISAALLIVGGFVDGSPLQPPGLTGDITVVGFGPELVTDKG